MRRCLPYTIMALALAYALYIHLTAAVLPYDDAFITYRYARNLYARQGLVYNTGERVFGVSTPLYMAWVILLRAFTDDAGLPALVVRSNVLWYVTAHVALFLLLRRLGSSALFAAVISSASAIHPWLLDISLGGMESFAFAALVMGVLCAVAADRPSVTGILAGLAAVMRPEGMLVASPVFLWCLHRRHARSALYALVPGLIWIAVAVPYYGTPIPHSLLAKMAPLYPLPFAQTAARFAHAIVSFFVPLSPSAPVLLALSSVLLLSLYALVRQRRTSTYPLALSFLALSVFYSQPHIFILDWYMPIVYVLALATTSLGLYAYSHRFHPCLAPLSLLVLILPVLVDSGHVTHYPIPTDARLRIGAYREAAEWLDMRVGSTDVVLAPEIGALGYYGYFSVLDSCALVSPEALPYHPIPATKHVQPVLGAIPAGLVRSVAPRYLVMVPAFGRDTVLVDPWFIQTYRNTHQISLPGPYWGAHDVVIYARRLGAVTLRRHP